jgi:hypothetical protein
MIMSDFNNFIHDQRLDEADGYIIKDFESLRIQKEIGKVLNRFAANPHTTAERVIRGK